MLLISDVHGAWEALAAVADTDEPLLVLGDLVNLVDYRTMDGILAEVFGRPLVEEVSRLRLLGRYDEARACWQAASAGREDETRARLGHLLGESYVRAAAALDGADAYVTYGNVDHPGMLEGSLPSTARFVDGEVVEIQGWRIGFAGGGIGPDDGAPGIVSEQEMAAKLAGLGDLDVLCTHVAPAVRQLSHDVVAGRPKGSAAVAEFLQERRPAFHYFGDVHQPQAVEWRVGGTRCRNVGYFRATGRGLRHG
ncbi:MAG: metallophosphoesterase [Actinobacteria bacterium]|nr:metallophosphoesterase [Actinomycetota bacterium]